MSKEKKQIEKFRRKWEEAIDRIFDSAASNKSENKTPLYDSGIDNYLGKVPFVNSAPEIKIVQILDKKKPKHSSQKKKKVGYADFI